MDKAFEIQQQARDNAKAYQTYLTDLQNWEIEMKRKEAALNGEFDQELPPVRSKKEKPVQLKKKPGKRITASDYIAWEKFDVDKACEEVDMADLGPVSLDGKKSQRDKTEKLRQEAQNEKEKGNNYVKKEKWDEAICCYNRAIELVKDDAIYYANRGLCYLKKDSLHQADADCTEALRLDPTYVKALQRRATAREKLGSLRAASHDLNEVLKLEPHNAAARKQLEAIKSRMGTKGTKSKSSPTIESEPQPKIIELPDEPKKEMSPVEKWKNGVNENITVIRPVKKPPHLRSKRALKHVTIQEIPLGRTLLEKQRMKIEVNYNDTNNNDNNDLNNKNVINSEVPVSNNMNMVPPMNSVQFMSDWKYLKGNDGARSDYLSIINPAKLPSIFENALESDVLSEVISTLHNNKDKFRQISAYLTGLSRVKRFSALAMFLTTDDKRLLNNMLEHCKAVDNISDSELTDLINKYEL